MSTEKLPTPTATGSEGEHQPARRIAWGWWFFAAVAVFYLFAEHRVHLFGALPLLLLLACPLMHLFMHHGHERHRHDSDTPRREDSP